MSRLSKEINEFNKYLDPHLHIGAEFTGVIMIVKMYYGTTMVARLQCVLDGSKLFIELGRTNASYRRRGFGTQIRAIVLWCAKRAGYKRADQDSMFMSNSNTSRSRPPSAYIMNKLGFGFANKNSNSNSNSNSNNSSEHRVLNLNRNIPGVNAVIRKIME